MKYRAANSYSQNAKIGQIAEEGIFVSPICANAIERIEYWKVSAGATGIDARTLLAGNLPYVKFVQVLMSSATYDVTM